jgi:hypothetical protein
MLSEAKDPRKLSSQATITGFSPALFSLFLPPAELNTSYLIARRQLRIVIPKQAKRERNRLFATNKTDSSLRSE